MFYIVTEAEKVKALILQNIVSWLYVYYKRKDNSGEMKMEELKQQKPPVIFSLFEVIRNIFGSKVFSNKHYSSYSNK